MWRRIMIPIFIGYDDKAYMDYMDHDIHARKRPLNLLTCHCCMCVMYCYCRIHLIVLWNECTSMSEYERLDYIYIYALCIKCIVYMVIVQCSWKTFMVHQTFVQWALYILFKFVKSLIRHLGLAIGNVRHVRWFSWTLLCIYYALCLNPCMYVQSIKLLPLTN